MMLLVTFEEFNALYGKGNKLAIKWLVSINLCKEKKQTNYIMLLLIGCFFI